MRVLILGTAGAGKTTLATALSRRYELSLIELDVYFWGPDWTASDRTVFRETISNLVAGEPRWVADGNYRSVRELLVRSADVIVWLDYPLWRCQWRLARRTALRILMRQRLFHGNRESAINLIRTRFEFFRWAAGEHRRLRTEIPELVAEDAVPLVVRIHRRQDLATLDQTLQKICSRTACRAT